MRIISLNGFFYFQFSHNSQAEKEVFNQTLNALNILKPYLSKSKSVNDGKQALVSAVKPTQTPDTKPPAPGNTKPSLKTIILNRLTSRI